MIDEENVLADTGRVPLRYLIDGNKRSTASLNVTKDGILYGTMSLEIQIMRRNQPASK
jgi:hypothetical protein